MHEFEIGLVMRGSTGVLIPTAAFRHVQITSEQLGFDHRLALATQLDRQIKLLKAPVVLPVAA